MPFTNADVLVFEALFALFTMSAMVLVFYAVRLMRRMERCLPSAGSGRALSIARSKRA